MFKVKDMMAQHVTSVGVNITFDEGWACFCATT